MAWKCCRESNPESQLCRPWLPTRSQHLGADDGPRTRFPQFGRLMLVLMSFIRVAVTGFEPAHSSLRGRWTANLSYTAVLLSLSLGGLAVLLSLLKERSLLATERLLGALSLRHEAILAARAGLEPTSHWVRTSRVANYLSTEHRAPPPGYDPGTPRLTAECSAS